MFNPNLLIVFIPIAAQRTRGPGLSPEWGGGGNGGHSPPPPPHSGESPGPLVRCAAIGMNTMRRLGLNMGSRVQRRPHSRICRSISSSITTFSSHNSTRHSVRQHRRCGARIGPYHLQHSRNCRHGEYIVGYSMTLVHRRRGRGLLCGCRII